MVARPENRQLSLDNPGGLSSHGRAAKRSPHMNVLPELSPETYSLFQFTLTTREEGTASQKSHCWGDNFSIEDAFNAAKSLVTRDYEAMHTLLAQKAAKDAPINLQINDTEFGYDLRHNYLVVSRYWIHAKASLKKTV